MLEIDLTTVTVVLLSTFVVILLDKLFGSSQRKFPSPWGLPLLGHVAFIGRNPVETVNNWAKKYGPVIDLQFAWIRVVVLNDRKSITECFSLREFSGRKASTKIIQHIGERAGPGLVFEDFPNAEELRGFFLKAFRNHGLQKNKMEEHILGEVGELIVSWNGKKGADFKLSSAFSQLSVNCVWRVLGTKRFELEETQEISDLIKSTSEMDSILSLLSAFYPKLVNSISDVVRNKMTSFHVLNKMIQGTCVEERQVDRIRGQPRDIIDQFLDQIDETENEDSVFHKTKTSIAPALRDVLLASVEAIATTLEWFVLYGIRYPDVIRKLQEEIDTVVGGGRPPTMDDRGNMPYAEACVLEILRKPVLAPFGIPHCTTEDREFRGVLLKKGTLVVSNLYAIHNDPRIWEQPEKFMPERFLSSDGTLISNAWGKIMPFGAGKRMCLGSSFIGDELFLIITGLYQKFNIHTLNKNISLEEAFGLTVRPRHDIRIFVKPRV